MKMHTNSHWGRFLGRLAVAGPVALGLTACDESSGSSGILGPPLPIEEVLAGQVSAAYAEAGDTVWVEFDLAAPGRDRQETLLATVEWDAERFEYLGVLEADADAILEGRPVDGTLQIRLDSGSGFAHAELVVGFRARMDGETHGFNLTNIRGVAAEREGESERDVA